MHVCVCVCVCAGACSSLSQCWNSSVGAKGLLEDWECSVLKEAGACPLNGLPIFLSSRGDDVGMRRRMGTLCPVSVYTEDGPLPPKRPHQ